MFGEIDPEIRPETFGAFLAGRTVLPQRFHIRDFKFQIKFHQKSSQRTSAGMATLTSCVEYYVSGAPKGGCGLPGLS